MSGRAQRTRAKRRQNNRAYEKQRASAHKRLMADAQRVHGCACDWCCYRVYEVLLRHGDPGPALACPQQAAALRSQPVPEPVAARSESVPPTATSKVLTAKERQREQYWRGVLDRIASKHGFELRENVAAQLNKGLPPQMEYADLKAKFGLGGSMTDRDIRTEMRIQRALEQIRKNTGQDREAGDLEAPRIVIATQMPDGAPT